MLADSGRIVAAKKNQLLFEICTATVQQNSAVGCEPAAQTIKSNPGETSWHFVR